MSNDGSKKKNQSRQSKKKKDTLKKNTWVKSG
jgi:hypothetical protein